MHPCIKSAGRPSIEAKISRECQKRLFLFSPQEGRRIPKRQSRQELAVDRIRPAKVSREAARGPSGGFSLFLRSEKEKMGGASAQPSSWLNPARCPPGQE